MYNKTVMDHFRNPRNVGVIDDAERLRLSAEELRNESLFFAAIGSGFGVGFFLLLSYFGWRFLKKRYFSRISAMKQNWRCNLEF